MKMNELVKEAQKEMKEDKKNMAKGIIKERIKEIELTERTLKKLKKQYSELLKKDMDEIVDESDEW